jgi:Rps23 Pro-64 3,4-dihydroxylase Tpa1-like proline 4-hydroxylase
MLSKPTIFAERIFYYESILDDPYSIIDAIELSDKELSDKSLITNWHTWLSSDGSYTFGQRKSTNAENFSEATVEVKKIYTLLDNLLSVYGKDYANKLQVILGEKKAISISKYFTGSSMGKHADSSPNPTIENISAVLYLNDDYSGGEIAFPDHEVVIKPTAGSLIIFPSRPPFFHESREVTSGTKYMSPAFWHLIP